MEKERLAREKVEQEKAEKAKKMEEVFGNTNSEWEQDKANMQQHLVKQDPAGEAPQKDTQGQGQGVEGK